MAETRLRQLRKARGESLRVLANLCGVTEHTLWFWDHGKRNPDAASLIVLADHFGVDPRELVVNQ